MDYKTLLEACTCAAKSTNVEAVTNDLKKMIPGIIVMFAPDGKLEIEPPIDYPYEDFTDEDLEKIYDYITTNTDIEIDTADISEDDEMADAEDDEEEDDYYGIVDYGDVDRFEELNFDDD